MFADLNLAVEGATPQRQREALAAAVALGYGTVALTRTVTAPFSPRDLPTVLSPSEEAVLAASPAARVSASRIQSVVAGMPALRQLRRLTVRGPLSDESRMEGADSILASLQQAQQAGSLHALHIVAAQPRTQAALAKLCTSTQVDCICLDIATKLPFKLPFPMVAAAVKRGIFFEIQYAPLLDPATVRQAIINCQMILEVTKGRNIVLSSGASNPSQLRSPQAAASLGALFRLRQGAAARALSSSALALLDAARKRRLLYRDTVWLHDLPFISTTQQTGPAGSTTAQGQAADAPQHHSHPAMSQPGAPLAKSTQPAPSPALPLPAASGGPVCFSSVLQLRGAAGSAQAPGRRQASSVAESGFLSLDMDMDMEWETVSRKSNRKAKRKH